MIAGKRSASRSVSAFGRWGSATAAATKAGSFAEAPKPGPEVKAKSAIAAKVLAMRRFIFDSLMWCKSQTSRDSGRQKGGIFALVGNCGAAFTPNGDFVMRCG